LRDPPACLAPRLRVPGARRPTAGRGSRPTGAWIVLRAYPERRRKTVANFLQYVKDGHYNGTTFHRVIDGLHGPGRRLRQGHAPEADDPTAGPERSGERSEERQRHDRHGAHVDPHSATAQFFINVKNNDFLNYREPTAQGYGYTVFGKVVTGMDIVDRIAKSPTGNAASTRTSRGSRSSSSRRPFFPAK